MRVLNAKTLEALKNKTNENMNDYVYIKTFSHPQFEPFQDGGQGLLLPT